MCLKDRALLAALCIGGCTATPQPFSPGCSEHLAAVPQAQAGEACHIFLLGTFPRRGVPPGGRKSRSPHQYGASAITWTWRLRRLEVSSAVNLQLEIIFLYEII